MGYVRLFAVCCVLVSVQEVLVVNALSMDEVISNAAETTEEFSFFQGSNEKPQIKVELDMIFTPKQWEEIQRASGTYGDESGRQRRKAIRSSTYRWPNGVIPYEIAPGIFSSSARNEIQKALNEWQTYTCLSFRYARSSDSSRIRFDNGGGCFSNVGKIGGTQTVGLANGCRYKGVVIHEVGHAVGFQHEQTRPDRDDYVQIIRNNIPPHLYYNFQKYSRASVNDYLVPYDYKSIMHYGSKAFSVNGGLTIKTRDPKYQSVIGNRQGLSFRDIKLANLMYQCNAGCSNKDVRCPGEGFVDKNCRCMCPGNPIKECSDTGTASTTTPRTGNGKTTTTTGTTNECVDRHTSCSAWASRGECQRYRFFMSTYCKKSCQICREENQNCKDMGEHCAYWEKQGYCRRKYVTYMSSNCAKTCNTCDSANTEMGGSNGSNDNDVDTRAETGDVDTSDENAAVTSLPTLFSVMVMVAVSAALQI